MKLRLKSGTQPSPTQEHGHASSAGDAPGLSDCSDSQEILGLSDLYIPEEPEDAHIRDVADVLLESGKITAEHLASLRKQQSLRPGSDAATLLLNQGLCRTDDLLAAKAELCNLEFRNISPDQVQKEAFEKLDPEFMRTN
jgi:hypothetical protein